MKNIVDDKKSQHHKQVVKKQKQSIYANNRAKYNIRANLKTIIENSNKYILSIELKDYNQIKESNK